MSEAIMETKDIIESLGYHSRDTGSSGVQVAILTEQIKKLTAHMKENLKDFRSKRSLQIMVAKRRKHLDYLKRTNPEKYREVLRKLNLRK
ncbi:MAG: 30S ribosomal protein S15 [Candidatus Auribacterota bacterium]|nr:30S ribosomal protein S15 [Candidatus Auribacterota bacterium]